MYCMCCWYRNRYRNRNFAVAATKTNGQKFDPESRESKKQQQPRMEGLANMVEKVSARSDSAVLRPKQWPFLMA